MSLQPIVFTLGRITIWAQESGQQLHVLAWTQKDTFVLYMQQKQIKQWWWQYIYIFFWWNGQAFDLWPWRFCHQFWSVVLKRPLLVVVGSAPPLTDSLSVSSPVWTQYMASASLMLPKGKLKVLPGLLVAVLLLSLFFFLFQFNKEAELRPFAPTRMCWRVFSLSLLWDSMVALRSTCWHTC